MTPPVAVAGRVAVVTGASRGLGAGLAVHFAGSGMHLGLCSRHRPILVARTRPTAHDGHIVSSERPVLSAVDVTDRTALDRFVAEVVARFGRIDLWVNNAGLLGPIGPLVEADAVELARTIAVNVTGTLNGTAVYAEHVRSRPGPGVLVNISSGAGTTPYAGWAAYCSSKAAVDQLTRVVAMEEADHGLPRLLGGPRPGGHGHADDHPRHRRGSVSRGGAFPPRRGGAPVQLPGLGGRAHPHYRVRAGATGESDAAHPGSGRLRPGRIRSAPMPKSGARKVVKPVAAAAVTLGTIASIWWFALKPRRKAKGAGITNEKK